MNSRKASIMGVLGKGCWQEFVLCSSSCTWFWTDWEDRVDGSELLTVADAAVFSTAPQSRYDATCAKAGSTGAESVGSGSSIGRRYAPSAFQ